MIIDLEKLDEYSITELKDYAHRLNSKANELEYPNKHITFHYVQELLDKAGWVQDSEDKRRWKYLDCSVFNCPHLCGYTAFQEQTHIMDSVASIHFRKATIKEDCSISERVEYITSVKRAIQKCKERMDEKYKNERS